MTDGTPRRPLVVIPTYNERDNIDGLLGELLAVSPWLNVLVVDDASPDGTGLAVDSWANRDSRIHVLHRARKLGLGTAYRDGFRWGLEHGYDALLEMDADFSHSPSYIPALIAGCVQADLVIGSRYVEGGGTRGWGWHRRLLSSSANLFARVMLGLPVKDCTAGFRCYRAAILTRIGPDSILAEGYSFQVEMLVRVLRTGGSVKEIPILFEERRRGSSKISRGEILRAIQTILLLASRPGPRTQSGT